MAVPAADNTTPAERLRTTMAACRVEFTWFGTKKSLTAEQKAQAAEPSTPRVSSSRPARSCSTRSTPAFRAVTAIRTRSATTGGLTLPFPKPGIRLIKLDQVEAFDRQMADYKAELDDAVGTATDTSSELKAAARRLGSLFNPADYPETLIGLFGVSLDFPSVEPPDYLVRLSPDLYRAGAGAVRARFQEAVQLAEQAFLDEFAGVVNHLPSGYRFKRRRNAQSLPRLCCRQPLGLLRALPHFERAQQPATR